MKVKLIAFQDGIVNIGLRRLSSLVKSHYPQTTTYIYDIGGIKSIARNAIFQQRMDDCQ